MAWENSLNDPREQCLQYTHQPLLYIRTKVVLRWKIEWQKMERRALNFEKFLLLRTWKGWVWVVVVYMWKKRVKRGTSFSTNDPGYVLHRCCITTKVYIHPLPTPVKNWKLKTFFLDIFLTVRWAYSVHPSVLDGWHSLSICLLTSLVTKTVQSTSKYGT